MKTQITEKELAEAIGAHRLWLANKGGRKIRPQWRRPQGRRPKERKSRGRRPQGRRH